MFLLKRSGGGGSAGSFDNLHSTMFLLKPALEEGKADKTTHLHSTMFLLKRLCSRLPTTASYPFTFHNVSIKTTGKDRLLQPYNHLHSTMFLLKLYNLVWCQLPGAIYIPQCFY